MYATLATCSLDQWSLDFEGNKKRILASCEKAKSLGARYRLGPELEISGYGCEDHFLEGDTLEHSLRVLEDLLTSTATENLFCDFGLPFMHNNNVRYNVRVLCLNHEILCIRPKQALADDGNYRESRFFTRWSKKYGFDYHILDPRLQKFSKNGIVPFGDVSVRLKDCSIGVESCEEMFTSDDTNIRLGLNGIDIVGNGSGSHHQLRKLNTRVDLIKNSTQKSGGIYLYSNQTGCDGGRLGFDGCPLISCNGQILAQGKQFTVSDVEVITATINLQEMRTLRAFTASRGIQATNEPLIPQVIVDNWSLCSTTPPLSISKPIEVFYHTPEEEIAFGPAIWLWDYLRRSNANGFFLPLSGGADSSSVAAIVFSMCTLLSEAVKQGDEQVLTDLKRITSTDSNQTFQDPRQIANLLLNSAYFGTSNSSERTRNLAMDLSKDTGHYHLNMNIDAVVSTIIQFLETSLFTREDNKGKKLRYKVHGGTRTENLALQNIQARFRMIASYALAQLLPWVRGKNGFLLVLGSANVDEGLRGYLTKYDCSSADINPIGGISKIDLRKFLAWKAKTLPTLAKVLAQKSSAELEPITSEYTQISEDDMGCTFEELSLFGRLRKIHLMGPLSMYRHLSQKEWSHLPKNQVAEKVKFLFTHYAINRHKMTTITPSYHCEAYSPDDNRFDLRPFLYRSDWEYQFKLIDNEVKHTEGSHLKTPFHAPVSPLIPNIHHQQQQRVIIGGIQQQKRYYQNMISSTTNRRICKKICFLSRKLILLF